MPTPIVIGNASRWIGCNPIVETPLAEKAEFLFYSAILQQAIHDQDRYWFLGANESLVTFDDCCSVLGLNVSAARNAILATMPAPQTFKRHLYDSRPAKEEYDYEWTHLHGECANRHCAECEFRRLLRQRKANLSEWHREYMRVEWRERQAKKRAAKRKEA